MNRLAEVVEFLDEKLRTSEVPDFDDALNGLQLENDGSVSGIAAAVDFSLDTVAKAVASRCDLLLVHHGMFWGEPRTLTGPRRERLRMAIAGNLAVYSSHLPLDAHPDIGNNALLARELRLDITGTFGRYKTIEIGVRGSAETPTSELADRLSAFAKRHGSNLVATPFTPDRRTRTWAIITGAGASSTTLDEAVERGVDTLIVGEGPHHSAVQAMELGICVMYAGHYATETLGVRALGEMAASRFKVPLRFIDAPTGL